MKRTLLGIFALSLLALAACEDKSVDPVPPALTLAAFPHSIGDSWTYAVRDSSFENPVILDTVVVTIIDSVAFDCGQQDCTGTYEQIWQLEYTNKLDTMTVLYQHDSLYLKYPRVWLSLFFPLTLNKAWNPLYPIGAESMASGVIQVKTLELDNNSVANCMIVLGWQTSYPLTSSTESR